MKTKLAAAALAGSLALTSAACAVEVAPAEAWAIAKDAYVFGVPMVDTYIRDKTKDRANQPWTADLLKATPESE